MYGNCVVSLVSLAFSSAKRMAVISASSTDAESLSIMMISCVQLTQLPVSRHLNRQYSTCCRLDENGCILVISVILFPP